MNFKGRVIRSAFRACALAIFPLAAAILSGCAGLEFSASSSHTDIQNGIATTTTKTASAKLPLEQKGIDEPWQNYKKAPYLNPDDNGNYGSYDDAERGYNGSRAGSESQNYDSRAYGNNGPSNDDVNQEQSPRLPNIFRRAPVIVDIGSSGLRRFPKIRIAAAGGETVVADFDMPLLGGSSGFTGKADFFKAGADPRRDSPYMKAEFKGQKSVNGRIELQTITLIMPGVPPIDVQANNKSFANNPDYQDFMRQASWLVNCAGTAVNNMPNKRSANEIRKKTAFRKAGFGGYVFRKKASGPIC